MNSMLDNIFLSYDKILKKLKANGIKTKDGKEITYMDLRQAILIMLEKHPSCRWRSEKIRSKRYYILYEGYLWIQNVYFKKGKKQIDLDIEFFESRIKEYENILNIKSKLLFTKDYYIEDLKKYFNRASSTIKKAIYKMLKANNNNFRYVKDGKYIITREGIEWLCKNCFKQKYLEILEDYKMELTEQYIKEGYPYDNFFGRN